MLLKLNEWKLHDAIQAGLHILPPPLPQIPPKIKLEADLSGRAA